MRRGAVASIGAAGALVIALVIALRLADGAPGAQRALARSGVLLLAGALATWAWRQAPARKARVALVAAALFAGGVALVGGVARPAPGVRVLAAWGPVTSWPALELGAGPVGFHVTVGSAALLASAALLVAVALERARSPAGALAAAPPALLAACVPCALAWIPSGASREQDVIARVFLQSTVAAALAVGGVLIWIVLVALRRRARPGLPSRADWGRGARWGMLASFALVPAVIVFGLGASGLFALEQTERAPGEGGRLVEVVARQWEWEFRPAGEAATVGELVVRAGEPVHLMMTSEDVIHSLFVPELGIKQDVLPNATTHATFQPTRPGIYAAYCAEFCGRQHTYMSAQIRVLPEAST